MGKVARAIEAFFANFREPGRGAAQLDRNRSEAAKWAVMFPAGAAAQFRDARAWREVVPWGAIDDASRAYERWKQSTELTPDELRDKVRVEVRGERSGEMRVLAAPDVAAFRRPPRA